MSPATSPPATLNLVGGQLVWDPARQALVLFQSYDIAGYKLGISVWDGSNWTNKVVAEGYFNFGAAAALHKSRFILTRTTELATQQTFASDGNSVQLLVTDPMIPRFISAMAYDGLRDRTIALVYDDLQNYQTQTWSFDLGSACAFPAALGTGGGTLNLLGTAGYVNLNLNLPAGCSWTTKTSQSWLTVAPPSGTGPQTLAVNATTNPTLSKRSSVLEISGWYAWVWQDVAPCGPTGTMPASPFTVLSPCPASYTYTAAAGEQIAFRLIGTEDKSWSPYVRIWNADRTTLVLSSPSYSGTRVLVPASGTFSFPSAGTYQIEVGSSQGTADGTVAVTYVRTGGGCTPTLTRSNDGTPVTSVDIAGEPVPFAFPLFTVALAPGCPSLNVSSGATWLSASPQSVEPGYTTVTYMAEPNYAAAPRTTTVNIGATSIQSTQAASSCAYTLSSASATVDSNRTAGTLTLTSAYTGCRWTAASSASWLQVFPLSGSTASGNTSSLQYTVFPNFGSTTRSATLTVAGRTFTVTQGPSSGTAMERFVRLLYFNFFGRMPTAAEVAFQANSGQSRAQLASNFFGSQEFTNGGRFVAGLYVGVLSRDAEYGGWLFQRDALLNGINTWDPLIRNFLDSQEFYLRNGNLSNTQYVKLLYRQILLREPTTAEVDFQVSQLTGGTPRSILALSFLLSQEFVVGTGPRLVAFLSYAGLLQRDPTAAEFTAAKSTTLANLLNQIVNSAEFNAILE